MKEDILSRIQNYLKDYNKDGKYSYIFSYEPGFMFYKDSTLNITPDVIAGLNGLYAENKKWFDWAISNKYLSSIPSAKNGIFFMSEHATSFKPSLRLFDATMIVAGSMIGSGILPGLIIAALGIPIYYLVSPGKKSNSL